MTTGPTASTAEPNYEYPKNDNSMFFDKNGILDIDGMVADNDSFKAIMEDSIVTEDEVKAQSDKVIGILHDMETRYSEAQLTEIKDLLVESGVLYAVYNFYSIQNINR